MRRRPFLETTFAAIVGFSVAAQAEISIDWTAQNGWVPNRSETGGTLNEGLGILDPSVNPLGQVYAQLILSTDDLAGLASPGAGLSGDDTLLADVVIGRTGEAGNNIDDGGSGGTFYSGFLAGAPRVLEPFPVTAGYIYARVFETVAGSVDIGTWYYDGPIELVQDVNQVPLPELAQAYDSNANSLPGGFGDELNLQVVVPEPGTLSLLSLGVVGLVYHRHRRRKTVI